MIYIYIYIYTHYVVIALLLLLLLSILYYSVIATITMQRFNVVLSAAASKDRRKGKCSKKLHSIL